MSNLFPKAKAVLSAGANYYISGIGWCCNGFISITVGDISSLIAKRGSVKPKTFNKIGASAGVKRNAPNFHNQRKGFGARQGRHYA